MDASSLVPVIAAGASILAALIAAVSATVTKRAEQREARLRAMEDRLSTRRADAYLPFVNTLGDMLIPSRNAAASQRVETVTADFMNDAPLWASDDLMRAMFRWKMAAREGTPSAITVRLTGDLLIAFRRDLADSKTKTTALEVLGMRINDLPEHPDQVAAFTMPFEELAKRENWTPPWHDFDLPSLGSRWRFWS